MREIIISCCKGCRLFIEEVKVAEFCENYRKLSRLSVPILAPVKYSDLLSDMKTVSGNKTYIYIKQKTQKRH